MKSKISQVTSSAYKFDTVLEITKNQLKLLTLLCIT